MSNQNIQKFLSERELYCPAHFGNTYEATLDNEMSSLLEEAKFWGFNRFSDWFDTIDLYNLYAKKYDLFNTPEAMWQRKFGNFQCAAEQGLELGLVVTPNHVFYDQVREDTQAKTGGHIFGQLVCPSKPGVVEMILDNYRNIFQDFVDRDLKLESIAGGAYDYGGCLCERCQPWIVTFGKLFKQIAELAKEFFGEISVELWGWWWTDDDHINFSEWADREAYGFFNAFAFHLPYGATEYRVRPIPQECAEKAFVHIAYGERDGRDCYCHYGANIGPKRLERTVRYLVSRGAKGFLAYSEGDADDINKAVLAGLGSGRFSSAEDVLRVYAERHFGADPKGWCELLLMMGDFYTMDVGKVRPLFDKLSKGAKNTWRLQQIAERLNMAEAHRAVMRESEWTPSRIQAADAYVVAKERLYRNVWRLGLQRHIFQFNNNMPEWYDEYLKVKGKRIYKVRKISDEA